MFRDDITFGSGEPQPANMQSTKEQFGFVAKDGAAHVYVVHAYNWLDRAQEAKEKKLKDRTARLAPGEIKAVMAALKEASAVDELFQRNEAQILKAWDVVAEKFEAEYKAQAEKRPQLAADNVIALEA